MVPLAARWPGLLAEIVRANDSGGRAEMWISDQRAGATNWRHVSVNLEVAKGTGSFPLYLHELVAPRYHVELPDPL